MCSKKQSFCAVTPEAIRAQVITRTSPAFGDKFFLFCTVLEAETFEPLSNTYQWLKNDILLPSSTDSSLTFDSLSLSDVAEYKCEVTVSSPQLLTDVKVTSEGYQLVFEGKEYKFLFSCS